MFAQYTKAGWRLDPHSSLYAGLNRVPLSTVSYVVKQDEEFRPDLVALSCYGDITWWPILQFYNGVINPLTELVTGFTLQVPNATEVEALFKQGSIDTGSTVLQEV
jgi:hypothetical protein